MPDPSRQRITRLEERVKNLTGWQKSQNGAIHRVEDKVDKLQWWIMGCLAATLGSLIIRLLGVG